MRLEKTRHSKDQFSSKGCLCSAKIASGDLVGRTAIGMFTLSIVLGSIQAIQAIKKLLHGQRTPCCKLLLPLRHSCNKFYHTPHFSTHNTEKLREPGDEASSCNYCNYCKALKHKILQNLRT